MGESLEAGVRYRPILLKKSGGNILMAIVEAQSYAKQINLQIFGDIDLFNESMVPDFGSVSFSPLRFRFSSVQRDIASRLFQHNRPIAALSIKLISCFNSSLR